MNGSRMTGTCLCGAVRFEVTAEPITLYACHCSECQIASGASFVLVLKVPSDGIEVTRGEPRPFERARADGRRKNVFRCPQCLTALWSAHLQPSSYVNVYVGTLNEASKLKPVGHIWTQDAQPWIVLPNDGLVFQQEAPDPELFIRAWTERKASPSS